MYYLFVWKYGAANGGLNDYVGSFMSLEVAEGVAAESAKLGYNVSHIMYMNDNGELRKVQECYRRDL